MTRVDWSRLLLNLRRAGISNAAAARQAHADQKTVARLCRGEISEPRFSQGLALLDLHIHHCGEEKHKELLQNGGSQ